MTKPAQMVSIHPLYWVNKIIIQVIIISIYQFKYLNSFFFFFLIQSCHVSRISLAPPLGFKQKVKTFNNMNVSEVSHQNWNLRTGPVYNVCLFGLCVCMSGTVLSC